MFDRNDVCARSGIHSEEVLSTRKYLRLFLSRRRRSLPMPFHLPLCNFFFFLNFLRGSSLRRMGFPLRRVTALLFTLDELLRRHNGGSLALLSFPLSSLRLVRWINFSSRKVLLFQLPRQLGSCAPGEAPLSFASTHVVVPRRRKPRARRL